MKYSLFWHVIQRGVSYTADASGKPIGLVSGGQADQEELL